MRGTRYPDHAVDQDYRVSGAWDGRVLTDALVTAARTWPDRIAVTDKWGSLTFSELSCAATCVASAMTDAGVRSGDVISIQLPNGRHVIAYLWAALLLGAIVNPVVPIYRGRELAHILNEASPRLVVAPRSHRGTDYARVYAEILDPSPVRMMHVDLDAPLPAEPTSVLDASGPVDPDDVALLLYTSGTTASPKGVLHSHNTLRYEIYSQARIYGLGNDDVVFMPSPVTHITGFLWGCIAPVLLGIPVVHQDPWSPDDAWRMIADNRVTFTMFSAPFVKGLLSSPAAPATPPSHMRIVACGGADMSADLIASSSEAIGPTYRLYGASECPSAVAQWPGSSDADRLIVDGYPYGSTTVKVIGEDGTAVPAGEEGEVVWRGPDMFLGYLDPSHNAEAFTADGFGRSGDLGTMTADGALRISGRLKDIINRSGEKFSARDIEEALLVHPSIRDAAVVAAPDDETGERVCAYVVSDSESLTLAKLREFLLTQGMAIQKSPERLVVVNELPRTPSGKVMKNVLRMWEWTPDINRTNQRIEDRTR